MLNKVVWERGKWNRSSKLSSGGLQEGIVGVGSKKKLSASVEWRSVEGWMTAEEVGAVGAWVSTRVMSHAVESILVWLL